MCMLTVTLRKVVILSLLSLHSYLISDLFLTSVFMYLMFTWQCKQFKFYLSHLRNCILSLILSCGYKHL
jgi:hypothetical protein